jgi:hypothetical protein
MTRMTIMRTKDDNKAWLVGLDGEIVSEIENFDENLSAFDSEKAIVVDVRAHAASHVSWDS